MTSRKRLLKYSTGCSTSCSEEQQRKHRALLAICEENSMVTGGSLHQRPVMLKTFRFHGSYLPRRLNKKPFGGLYVLFSSPKMASDSAWLDFQCFYLLSFHRAHYDVIVISAPCMNITILLWVYEGILQCFNVSWSNTFLTFNITPISFATQVQMYLIWGFQFKLFSMIIPRNFVSLTSMIRFGSFCRSPITR